MLSIAKTSSIEMDMYLATLKTSLMLHSTISHKIITMSHLEKSIDNIFLGLFLNFKNVNVLQALIFYHGLTSTQNMKTCKMQIGPGGDILVLKC